MELFKHIRCRSLGGVAKGLFASRRLPHSGASLLLGYVVGVAKGLFASRRLLDIYCLLRVDREGVAKGLFASRRLKQTRDNPVHDTSAAVAKGLFASRRLKLPEMSLSPYKGEGCKGAFREQAIETGSVLPSRRGKPELQRGFSRAGD